MRKDTRCGLSIVILQISAKFLFCLNYICPYQLLKYCYLFNLLIHCTWSSWVCYVTFFILNLLLYRNIVSISKIFLDLSMLQQMYSILLFFKTQKNSPWWICTLDFPPWIIAKLCCKWLPINYYYKCYYHGQDWEQNSDYGFSSFR